MTVTSRPKEDWTGGDRCLNSILYNLWKPASEMPLPRAVPDPWRGQQSQGGRAAISRRAAVGCKRTDWLPRHCGHLSRTGQMPKSKVFAPQNTDAEICDSLLLPSFYGVDEKICWLPCRIICKRNAIYLHFINPVIMLAMNLPTWLLHVFFKCFTAFY